MGGKQSTESTSTNRNTGGHATTSAHQSNAIVSSRRNNRAVTSLSSSTRNPTLSFNGEGGVRAHGNGPHAHSEHRPHRANSTAETGMRFSRPGFEWFYTAQIPDNESLAEDGNASTSRNFSQAFASRTGNLSRSLPPYFFRPNRDSKCSMCNKMIPAEDVEVHFVMCLTKPRVTYNEDKLSTTCGECSICLEDLLEGESVARLPCLCVYHKVCIDKWFLKSQTCPEHPPD